MAERTELTEIPSTPWRGPAPIYDKFFDGSVWRLTLGEDTRSTNPVTAAKSIWSRAKNLGIKVSVKVESETTILVQKVEDAR